MITELGKIDILEDVRKRRNMSKAAFARLLGIGVSTYHRWYAEDVDGLAFSGALLKLGARSKQGSVEVDGILYECLDSNDGIERMPGAIQGKPFG